MREATKVLDRLRPNPPPRGSRLSAADGRRQLTYELLASGSGAVLAVFMWGHMFFVASILLGTSTFDAIATWMEDVYIAQPTVFVVLGLFVLHAVLAGRKVPAQLRERRRAFALGSDLRRAGRRWTGGDGHHRPHTESWLWIWQVRTALLIGVLGSFHIILMGLDIFTDLFGRMEGIEAVSSMARTRAGLVWLYLPLLLAVEFHASVGLLRIAVKWGPGARLSRKTLWRIEHVIFWSFIVLGLLVLVVLAGWIDPPLAFLRGGE
jgi:fumarate reductase subunit C